MSRILHGHTVGGTSTREWKTWRSMMQRCYKKYSHNWRRYGARGITVCKRWHSFSNFLKDMGTKPQGLTLERRDSNKSYSPANCYWATTAQQNRNKSDTRRITWNGKTQSLAEWSREIGVNEATLGARLGRYAMPLSRAMRSMDLRCTS